MDEHQLKKGHYVISDPAYMILKNQEGDQLFQHLINLFYKDANTFHHFIIDQLDIYMFRTLGGDGIFNGVGTDSGLIMIIETNQLKGDLRFRQEYSRGKIIQFDSERPVIACVEQFDLTLSNGIFIHTE